MQKEAEDALLKRKSRRRRSPEAEIGENNRDLSASGIEDAVMIDRKDMTEETS
jgi:hypothetical protein